LWRGAKGILVNLLPFFWRLFWCPVLNTFHLSDTLILGMLVKNIGTNSLLYSHFQRIQFTSKGYSLFLCPWCDGWIYS
jgi:hypothetical protein